MPASSNDRDSSYETRLMEQAGQGDSNAFALIYMRYRAPLLIYVRGIIQDPERAKEIVQEVFAKAYAVRSTYRPDAKVSVWLWRIAFHAAIDSQRKQTNEARLIAVQIDDPVDPERTATDFMSRERLQRCLTLLSERERTTVELFAFQGLSYAEIARELGQTLSSIRSTLYRARKILRASLDEETGQTLSCPRLTRSPPATGPTQE